MLGIDYIETGDIKVTVHKEHVGRLFKRKIEVVQRGIPKIVIVRTESNGGLQKENSVFNV